MRIACLAVLLTSHLASAQDRHAERAPLPHYRTPNSMQRSGDSQKVAWWAVPSVTRFDSTGYIGGAVHAKPGIFSRPCASTGPIADGTFGTDYGGIRLRATRVFLMPSANPACGPSASEKYRMEGPHLPDVFALQPFRKAVIEKKEETGGHGKCCDR
jgi:hypothetical protein